MDERPIIYVNRITNLSDARYCAGMGVDLLGFVIDPADPDYVNPASFQQMIGWVSGPKRVLEVGHAEVNLNFLREQYAPDYLHIPARRMNEFHDAPWKLIVEVPHDQWMPMKAESQVAFWIVTGHRDLRPQGSAVPYLVPGHHLQGPVVDYLQATGAGGVVLSGSQESAPGLKDYDHLSQVLEELNG